MLCASDRGPLRELSPNRKASSAGVSKPPLKRPALWASPVRGPPSSPPRSREPLSSRLGSPVPLLPASAATPVSAPPKAHLTRQHADNIRARLRLAYFKVVTNQATQPLSRLHEPNQVEIRRYCDSLKATTKTDEIKPEHSSPEDVSEAALEESGSDDSDNDDEDDGGDTEGDIAAKKLDQPAPLPAATPVRTSGSLGSGPGSSPLKNPAILNSAVKGTPASMGAAKSLLELGSW